jgi:glycosyltransferase involved in cell wall biosynthesis
VQADLFFFPSYGEGMPIVVLEAMLYGLPVVSRPVGGLPDLIENDRTGYLVDSLDAEAFVEPILTLIRNKDLYRNISQYNHQYALKHFTPEPARQQMISFFKAVDTLSKT